jgi:hypothetical protein
MKLTVNHKYLIMGLLAGGAMLYLYDQYDKKKKAAAKAKNPVDRASKIEYIISNIEALSGETLSGFDGDRFEFNFNLGQMMPKGEVIESSAADEFVISKNPTNAVDLFFNAEGSEADGDRFEMNFNLGKLMPKGEVIDVRAANQMVFSPNPTTENDVFLSADGENDVAFEECIQTLNELSDDELDVAYVIVKEKKNAPNKGVSEIAKAMGIVGEKLTQLKEVILSRLKKVHETKKKKKEKNDNATAGTKVAAPEKKSSAIGQISRKDFVNEVINRRVGAMSAGRRIDGYTPMIVNPAIKRRECRKKCYEAYPNNPKKQALCIAGCNKEVM